MFTEMPSARPQVWPLGLAFLAIVSPSRVGLAQRSMDERGDLLERATLARAAGDHAEALKSARRAAGFKMTASLRRFIVEEEMAAKEWLNAHVDAQKCTREAAAE